MVCGSARTHAACGVRIATDACRCPPVCVRAPGTPILITAGTKDGEAEMTTDQGAIYVTDNAAYTWSAAVQETVDATLNRTVSSGINGASYYGACGSRLGRRAYVVAFSRAVQRHPGKLVLGTGEGERTPQPHGDAWHQRHVILWCV